MNSTNILKVLKLSISLLIIAILFKLMHWQYSKILFSISIFSIIIFYPIRFYLKKDKIILDYAKLLLVLFGVTNFYLKVMHFPNHNIIVYGTPLFFYLWLLLEIFANNKNEESSSNSVLPFGVNIFLGLLIVFGTIFKIMHWPYSQHMLISGFILLALSFTINTFKK
jgi:GldL N-terminal domain